MRQRWFRRIGRQGSERIAFSAIRRRRCIGPRALIMLKRRFPCREFMPLYRVLRVMLGTDSRESRPTATLAMMQRLRAPPTLTMFRVVSQRHARPATRLRRGLTPASIIICLPSSFLAHTQQCSAARATRHRRLPRLRRSALPAIKRSIRPRKILCIRRPCSLRIVNSAIP